MEIAFKSRRLFLRALVSMDGGDEGEEEEGKFERKAVTVSALIQKAPIGLISVAISLRALSALSRAGSGEFN